MDISKEQELLAANLILPIIKDIIGPKISRLFENNKTIKVDKQKIKNVLETYLLKRYAKFMIIDTLALPNMQTLFIDLYEPLTVFAEDRRDGRIEVKIDSYPYDLIPRFGRVVIEDTAGMGKSTITKKIFMSIIETKVSVPILIELREINNSNSILKEIQTQLSSTENIVDSNLLVKLIEEGEFIFLLDGLDEISQHNREFVIKDLRTFIEKMGVNHCLITSRPEDVLTSFGDFKKFRIRPLILEEAFNLIKRYDYYSFKTIADLLINTLVDKNDQSLYEFLKNPFLVSLIFKTFEYKKDIPIKASEFYRQVYNALFEAHDLSKEGYYKRDKYSNLHSDDFDRVLRHIAYVTSIENEVGYDHDHLINIIEKVKKFVPDLNFKSSDYIKDLLETVPLFKKDGHSIK